MANNEGYARLSNGLWRNTKIRKIARKDPQALADWIMAISFCSDKLTDGGVHRQARRPRSARPGR